MLFMLLFRLAVVSGVLFASICYTELAFPILSALVAISGFSACAKLFCAAQSKTIIIVDLFKVFIAFPSDYGFPGIRTLPAWALEQTADAPAP